MANTNSTAATLSDIDVELIQDTFAIPELSQFQQQAVENLLNNKDVFVCKRTGCGKSLCYQALPVVWSVRQVDKTIIVVVPLLSIIEEQCTYLTGLGFNATTIQSCEVAEIAAKKYDFIFASPEVLLGEDRWRDTLVANRDVFGLIVIDEVHTMVQWGERAHGEEKAFREWFGRLGELRSLLPDLPLLALTATATVATRTNIKLKLGMASSVDVIESPDRPNIKLSVLKFAAKDNTKQLFDWLSEDLFGASRELPRHLIFCSSTKDVLNIHGDFISVLPSAMWKHVAMYHSSVLPETKKIIQEDFKNPSGNVRVLICTDAAGMGVNFPDVHSVVHYGPTRNISTFIQQIGRAGRDGNQSNHILLFHGRSLKNTDVDMKSYCLNTDRCRRADICSIYGSECEVLTKHLCCDVCSMQCSCDDSDSGCGVLEHPAKLQPAEEDCMPDTACNRRYRFVAIEHEDELKRQIAVYCRCLEGSTEDSCMVAKVPMHGLTNEIISQIVLHCGEIFTPEDLLNCSGLTSLEHAKEICSMITNMFDWDYVSEENEWSEEDWSDIG